MESKVEPNHIVVIGASAGGIGALQELVSQLHPQIDAAFFVVLHFSETGVGSFLVHKLQQGTLLRCELAEDGAPIRRGHLYVAPSDKHLIVSKEGIRLGLGPKENRWKPSIDVLFRSAAAAFNGRTIGIILTGYLNDGTAGMMAIQKSGGTCIVQDPNEAEYPDMPLSVLDHMRVDFCVSISRMGAVLEAAVQFEKEEIPVPEEVKAEAAISERAATGVENVGPLGNQSVFSCPDCGGVLFNVQNENSFMRFKCHTGHSYSAEDLLLEQEQGFMSTLWVALRFLEERKTLLTTLENQNLKRGFQSAARGYREKALELQEHIDRLKHVLFRVQKEDEHNLGHQEK